MATIKNQNVIYHFTILHSSARTQRENFSTNHICIGRFSATLGRVNEALFPVMFICKYELLRMARRICEGNERPTVAYKTRNLWCFSACNSHSRGA